MINIEERLKRIERKLFPENVKITYDFYIHCLKCCHVHHYVNSMDCKNIKCFFCGEDVEPKNIFEHEEAIFDEDLNQVKRLDQHTDANSYWTEDGKLIYLGQN